MKSIIISILVIILPCSCVFSNQNLKRSDIEKGLIPIRISANGLTFSHDAYAGDFIHLFRIILGVENTKKWKIFYENDEFIFYGNLVNKNTIGNLYRVEKKLLKKWIPLYNAENIQNVITDNIRRHILEKGFNIENEIEIKYISIPGIGFFENNENIRYQFEISCYHKAASCLFGHRRYKMNIVIIMDTEFNILESYWLGKFK